MKLKTLEDFDSKSYCVPESIDLFKKNLKAEAVKWVKYYKKHGYETYLLGKFLNITEEDLK